MTIDVQEFAPLGHGAVPVSFMREEVFKVVNLFERYQSWVAVRIAAGEELFLFLFRYIREHIFSFEVLQSQKRRGV